MSGRAISAVGWSVEELTKKYGFQSVRRISWKDVTPRDIISYEEGTPLIISDYQDHASWNPNFNITHFKDALEEPRTLTVRNIFSSEDSIMAVDNFLSQSATHPEQQGESKPFYAKDAPCPDDWAKWLESSRVLPAEVIPHAHNDMQRNLPRKYSPETLMTYLGYGDTYTPFHKDPCASSGQNLMVYAENGGSSFWFMTESTASPDVSSFFMGKLGSDLDWENYAALPEELEKAPFTIYVCEQVVGDLILVPPRSAHQVINNAGLTVKMSWSRMTLRGLEIAIYHELPIYRRVLRPEIYRTKWTLYYTIRQLAANLKRRRLDPAATLFTEDASRFERALRLFDYVLETEGPPVDTKMYGRKLDHLRIACTGSLAPASDLSCDFCSADIFNAFFECRSCRHGNNSIVICPGCYSEGRNCRCRSARPKTMRSFESLLQERNEFKQELEAVKRDVLPLAEAHNTLQDERLLKKTSQYGIFATACRIYAKAPSGKDQADRKCQALRKFETHTTVVGWNFHCQKGCHAYVCFLHLLLVAGVHPVDVFPAWDEESGDRLPFHRFHSPTSLDRLESKIPEIVQSQRDATPYRPGVRHQLTFEGMFLAHLARTHHPAHGVESAKPVSIGFFDNPGDFKSIKSIPTKRGGKKRKPEDNIESGRISKKNIAHAKPTPGPSSRGGASSSHSHVPVTPQRPAPTLHSLLTPPPGFAGSSPLGHLDSSLFSGTTNSLISFGQPMFSSPVRSQTPPRTLPSFQSSSQVSQPSTPLFLPVSSPVVEPAITPPPRPLTPAVPLSEKEPGQFSPIEESYPAPDPPRILPVNGQSPTQATTSQLHYDYNQDPLGRPMDTSPMLASIGVKPHGEFEGDSLPNPALTHPESGSPDPMDEDDASFAMDAYSFMLSSPGKRNGPS